MSQELYSKHIGTPANDPGFYIEIPQDNKEDNYLPDSCILTDKGLKKRALEALEKKKISVYNDLEDEYRENINLLLKIRSLDTNNITGFSHLVNVAKENDIKFQGRMAIYRILEKLNLRPSEVFKIQGKTGFSNSAVPKVLSCPFCPPGNNSIENVETTARRGNRRWCRNCGNGFRISYEGKRM